MVLSSFRSSNALQGAGERRPTTTTTTTTTTAAAAGVRAPYPAPDLAELNASLVALAAIFPDVRPEVFREMLCNFSDQSRLHVVAEQLLEHRAKWVKGRWRLGPRGTSSSAPKEVFEVGRKEEETDGHGDDGPVPPEEMFRTDSYKRAAKSALAQEFKGLSRSTIEGVLAEQNHSYSLSRPVLVGLAAKSWRNSLSTLWSKWRKTARPATDGEHHHMLVWVKKAGTASGEPALRETGDAELQRELHDALVRPVLDRRLERQEEISAELATLLNEQEAERAGALYECGCCLSDTTFERMATCTGGGDDAHAICFSCIQRGVDEALYGQSWGRGIDHVRGQVACLAPADGLRPCDGHIPHALARRAVTAKRGGARSWRRLESRLADEALLASGARLVRCPFCAYAEVDALHLEAEPAWRVDLAHPLRTAALVLAVVGLVPLLLLYALGARALGLPGLPDLVDGALAALVRRTHLPARFRCRSPSCLRASCLSCRGAWRDPHTCHESAALSLRTTVEAARTAALKRTCPRCGVGFVKDGGCNKMVCPCGYAMCYVCRRGITGAEGYRHFCQHFRPAGGNCAECERCDLYGGGRDEDGAVRRAGERAEREWRAGNGMGRELVALDGAGAGAWSLQGSADWWVGMVLRC